MCHGRAWSLSRKRPPTLPLTCVHFETSSLRCWTALAYGKLPVYSKPSTLYRNCAVLSSQSRVKGHKARTCQFLSIIKHGYGSWLTTSTPRTRNTRGPQRQRYPPHEQTTMFTRQHRSGTLPRGSLARFFVIHYRDTYYLWKDGQQWRSQIYC
jgi:hypothetical protein